MTRVAVTGAAGKTGRAVLEALAGRGVATRALVRRRSADAHADDSAAVDLATGEGLDEGLDGCAAVYVIAPNLHPHEPELVGGVLEAARRVGTDRVVYHSVAQPFAPAMPHHVDKARTEDLVRRSGLDWTVLQPCAYVQNFGDQLRAVPPSLVVPYSTRARFRLVDLADVAQAAALVLTSSGHTGATYELGGPDAVDLEDVRAAASEVLGVRVALSQVSIAEWETGAGAALDPPTRQRLAAMFDYYDRYGLLAGSAALHWLLDRPPRSLADVLARELTP